jgi:hypothetical protein
VTILRLTQEIRQRAPVIFDTIIDAGSFASWNPTIESSRQITTDEIGEGTIFEWKLRGFGWVRQHLEEFERDRRVRIVPEMKSLGGGHRFTLTDLGDRTQVDHELEMTPKGLFTLLGPLMTRTGRRNLRATADALQRHMEDGRSE